MGLKISNNCSKYLPRGKVYKNAAARRAVATLCAIILAWGGMVAAGHDREATAKEAVKRDGESGLAVPRFASLRASRVNLRRGPGTQYPTAWVYRRAGLPVEIIKEFETWRQVRDSEGATGWVLRSLLSQRRTALVLPWEVKKDQARPVVGLQKNASSRADTVVQVEAGVIANIRTCDGRWCYVTIDDFKGYILQNQLWGAYSDEVIQ